METHVRAFLVVLQAQERYSHNTILGYQNDLQHFSKYLYQHFGRPPEITDFNAEQVTAYLKSGDHIYKPSTVKRRLATLKHFARFLQLTGEREAFQFPAIDQILPPIPELSRSRKISILSNEQVASLIMAIKADPRPQARRDEAIFRLILEIGITVSQLANINLTDFDQHSNRLRIQKSTGENRRFHIENSGPTLKRYLLEGRPELNPTPGETALFISQMGTRVSRQGVWQICQRWGKKIGIKDNLSPRILRHTAVHRLIQAGFPEKSIQEILEYQNLEATQGLLQRISELV